MCAPREGMRFCHLGCAVNGSFSIHLWVGAKKIYPSARFLVYHVYLTGVRTRFVSKSIPICLALDVPDMYLRGLCEDIQY